MRHPSPRSPLPTSEMTDTPMTPDELEAHGYPRDFHSRKYALPPLANSQEGMEGIGPDGEFAASPPSLEEMKSKSSTPIRDDQEKSTASSRATASAPLASWEYKLNAFEEAARRVESCGCESMPCHHVVDWRFARLALIAEIRRLESLVLTPAEAAAVLNASTYSKSSVSGFAKIRVMRDAK